MPHTHTAAVVDRLLRRLASDGRRPEWPPNTAEDVADVGRNLARLQDVLFSLGTRTEAQEWMGKIKQITYDMEDLLDEFEYRSTTIRSQWSGSWIGKAASFSLHNPTENKVKTIKRRLEFAAKDSVIFNLMQNPWPDVEPLDNGLSDGSAIVGRDNDKSMIMDILLQSNAEKLLVIPIVGLAGLGKTSLARLIFYDQEEGWNFDHHIWICLNRKLDLNKVAMGIISQCSQTKEKLLSVHRDFEIHEDLQLLKNRLQDVLHGKSCLIVLDDLTSTDKSQLDELKEMLSNTNGCTKVLVTTSNETTAELVSTLPPYKLHPLSEDDIWTIFSQKAFGNGNRISEHLKEMGKQIAKRSEGIPLLACSLGSVVKDQVIDVWLAARDEKIWKLDRRFASKMELFSSFYQVYNALPSEIKLCFLYLSIFPKGSVIDKEKLIQQWIALGMIGSKHGSLPSYVHGELCIRDLLSIHFLQVVKMHSIEEMDNRIAPTSLYMHNFVHEFVFHVACDDIIILDESEMRKDKSRGQTFQYALLMHYRGQSTLFHSLLTRIKALHIRNSEATSFHSGVFKLLKHLRVLDLSGCSIGELPASVGHLKCLRYLDVSGIPIQILPSTVGRLTNLETLDLSKTSLKELPYVVTNLLKLKHLNIQGCDKLQNLPAALGNLERLEHLRLSSCNDLGELPDSMCNLHDLRFFDLSRCTELQHLPTCFGNLVSLEDLSLSSCFNLKKLPESFGNLCFLRFLNLSSCYELELLPESLTKLDKLEVLILRRCYRLQNLPTCLADIKFLRVLDLAGCEVLHVGTEMLSTNLEYLNLRRCLKLQSQPHCFENFTKLKFLNLSQCLRSTDCLQSVGCLFNLEYLNLSENFLDIPVFFARLQKLHTLDLTGGRPIQRSINAYQILPDIISKMTALRFLLTKDPVLAACLPAHIRCFVDIDENWHERTDELVIEDITGGPRGLSIAERLNLQSRLELRSLKLQWIPSSRSDIYELVCNANDDEVLEKLQPDQSLEHFVLVKYAGHAFPTWMMNNMITAFPYLVSLCLFHLQNCNDLPPLGKLNNLRYLHINDMPNLRNLDMGLSWGPQPLKKLTHLKLESLMNLKELSILFSIDTLDQDFFMFPLLEELSVLSCPKLIFKPSLPRCKRYEIRECNNILSCGEPLGPLSSPSPTKIEISGCLVSPSWLQWFNSMNSLKKVVIVESVGDDGAALISCEFREIKGTQEPSITKFPHETITESSSETNIFTQDDAHKVAGVGSGSSTISVDSVPSSEVSASSEKILLAPPRMPKSPYGFVPSPQIARAGSVNLTLEQIIRATQNFSPSFKLGEGGFGTVYKAALADGHVVAVKRVGKDQFRGPRDEFSNEVELLANLEHRNLVRLLGFSDEGDERIIVTEYVPNGTLREHLDGQHGRILDFNQRLEIAIDVAHAVTYLHLYADKMIIHRDVKSSNILLTDSYRAKVTGFGFARSWPSDTQKTVISTKVKGTAGYLDPEYLRTNQLTPKSDVFSFGVLLLEIISARRPIELKRTPLERFTVRWAFKKFNEGNIREILDPMLEGPVEDEVLVKLLTLAFLCVNPTGEDRPTMKEVGEQLWKIRKEYGKSAWKV